MTFLLAMRQRALKQEKIKNPDHDTIVLGDDQIVRTARIRSTEDSFHIGISWFKREESVSYVAKTCKGGLSIKTFLLINCLFGKREAVIFFTVNLTSLILAFLSRYDATRKLVFID